MDVEHARTFIAVMETRSFVHAAKQLFVTQSTVSARIKALEDRLGCRLFTRNKAGVSLTAAGIQFSRHAMTFIRAWGQARQEVALPESYTARINIGAQISHWDDLMVNWMCWLRQVHPDLAVRAEIGSNESLMRHMVDGLLDFAVIYTPHAGPGLRIEKLFEEEIVLVGTRRYPRAARDEAPAWEKDYVFVDWGAEFRNDHALAWPDLATPAVHFGIGTVALEFILRTGGVAYLPLRMVRRHVKERRLFRVPDAPVFRRPVFLVMTADSAEPPLKEVLDGLRWIAVSHQLGEEADSGAANQFPPTVKASA